MTRGRRAQFVPGSRLVNRYWTPACPRQRERGHVRELSFSDALAAVPDGDPVRGPLRVPAIARSRMWSLASAVSSVMPAAFASAAP
jgi:hypothetical protein